VRLRARTTWKAHERDVARLLGGARHPANRGGRVDVTSDRFVAQCKNVRAMSLAQIEALAVEIEGLGERAGKVGLVVIKRSAGPGRPTPALVILTQAAWTALTFEPSDHSLHHDAAPVRRTPTQAERMT
jgi:hypothetical protein